MSDTTDTKDLGNTSTKSLSTIKSRKWCFTINNYTDEMLTQLHNTFKDKKWTYIIGKEIGEKGTKHLQGYLEAKNAIRFDTLKGIMPCAHIEKTKGTLEQNKKYCSKEGDFITNIEKNIDEMYDEYMTKRYKDVSWYEWQKNILEIINTEANERDIYWIWEPTGNRGKSFLCKYIDWKYNTVLVNGKQSDVFNGVRTYLENEKKFPQVALVDIPRSNKDYVCYGTIEKLKDGNAYSGKYEGGKLRLIPLHVFVFANFEPKRSEMSEDRWKIIELE